jgi:hypothetical protein
LFSVAGALVCAGGMMATALPASAAVPTVDVTHDKVQCNTIVGKIKFTTALTLTGPSTGANTIKVSAVVDGCTDSSNANVHIKATHLGITLSTNNGTGCTGLFGSSVISPSAIATIHWVAADPTVEKLVMTGNVPAATTDTISAVTGGTTPADNQIDTWGGTYGEFSVSAPSQEAVTGAFLGSDSGASSFFTATTGQDVGALLSACSGIKGLKSLNFGIGGIAFG